MIIGFLSIDIYLPYSHSLKEKRKRLVGMRDRLKKKYNVAFSELDYQDKWQRSKIGLVSLNTQKKVIEKLFHKIEVDIQDSIDGEILHKEIVFF